MRYYVGQVGRRRTGGKHHFYPEDETTGAARLETVCPVEDQVGFLRRADVRGELGSRTVEEWVQYADAPETKVPRGALCGHCVRIAREDDHGS